MKPGRTKREKQERKEARRQPGGPGHRVMGFQKESEKRREGSQCFYFVPGEQRAWVSWAERPLRAGMMGGMRRTEGEGEREGEGVGIQAGRWEGWAASLTPAWQSRKCRAQGLGWLLRQWEPRRVLGRGRAWKGAGASEGCGCCQVQWGRWVGGERGGSRGGMQAGRQTCTAMPRLSGSWELQAPPEPAVNPRAGPGVCAQPSLRPAGQQVVGTAVSASQAPEGLAPARCRGEAGGKHRLSPQVSWGRETCPWANPLCRGG